MCDSQAELLHRQAATMLCGSGTADFRDRWGVLSKPTVANG